MTPTTSWADDIRTYRLPGTDLNIRIITNHGRIPAADHTTIRRILDLRDRQTPDPINLTGSDQ